MLSSRGLRRICVVDVVMRLFAGGGERFYKPFCGNAQQTKTESTPHVEGWRNFSNQFSVTTNTTLLTDSSVTAVLGSKYTLSIKITNHFYVVVTTTQRHTHHHRSASQRSAPRAPLQPKTSLRISVRNIAFYLQKTDRISVCIPAC
jgi:hypothetical protein